MNVISTEVEIRLALARSSTYKLLGKSFLYPTQVVFDSIYSELYDETLMHFLSVQQNGLEMGKGIQELHLPGLIDREELEKEYNRLFAHLGSAKCPPYETEYGYDNVFQKTEAMADIGGFYRAYGLEVSDKTTERVDFISTELEFMSYLTMKEAYARENSEEEHLEICLDTERKFLLDHVGRWITIFAKILSNSTVNEFYLQLGKLTEEFMDVEARLLGVELKKIMEPNKNLIMQPPTPFGCDACVHVQDSDQGTSNTCNVKFDV